MKANDTIPVLITGETGTGKELVAQAIHYQSRRSKGPLIPLSCATIPEGMIESELFGHKRSAFSDAITDRPGAFEEADGGTIFLDEIGELPLSMQPRLLRVLQEKKVKRLGENRERPVDVRVVAATNRDLEAEVRNGNFREDLYFRLAGFPITVPPLRNRPEDIPLLANHFLNRCAEEMGQKRPALRSDTLDALIEYTFPGNVRELKNIIERALIESDGKTILRRHLHFEQNRDVPPEAGDLRDEVQAVDSLIQSVISERLSYGASLDRFKRRLIEQTLHECSGNRSKAARWLDMHRPNLVALIKNLGLTTDRKPAD
ncbi:MAG: sigma-54 dependent transcriptional regulator [Candidatus Poribacteria bacterium]|nr:sigma-54 dependent transcriptional regulator [Candidatus Poribacteria bacterium]